MPDSIANCVELRTLDLTCNKLEILTVNVLSSLSKLEQLLLSGNTLEDIPEDICLISTLEVYRARVVVLFQLLKYTK